MISFSLFREGLEILKKLVGLIVKASEIAKEAEQFHVFFFKLFSIFFCGSSEAILRALFEESERILF